MTDEPRRGRDDELVADSTANTASREAAERGESEAATGTDRTVGEAGGAAAGAAAGAAGGTITLGPVGALIGAIGGAIGGWWVGHEATAPESQPTGDDERIYREHYESSPFRQADRPYNDYRAGYWLGHAARRNPEYANRSFADVERDLQRGWTDEMRRRYGDWASMRGYVRAAFERREPSAINDPDLLQDRTP